MSQPTAYNRLVNFVSYAMAHTGAPYNPSDHDLEFNAVELTLDGLCNNIMLIQRDDGQLANVSVHPDSLSAAVLMLIETAGSATGLPALVRGQWKPATAYKVGELVQNLTISYICGVNHTSGANFNADYTAGKWIVLGSSAVSDAAGISFAPIGNVSSTNIQAAIQELDTEKAPVAGSSAQQFMVADASGAAHAVTMAQIQKNSLLFAVAGGTGNALTATLQSGLAALVDGMEFVIQAPGSNSIPNPTLALTFGSTATGAKTIVKGNGVALLNGDIAGNKCLFSYDAASDKWVLLTPAFPVGMLPPEPSIFPISVSVASNALTMTLLPCVINFRSKNMWEGTIFTRVVSSPISTVISAGSTAGFISGVQGRIYVLALDVNGTVELAWMNNKAYAINEDGLTSTTAEGGAGAADSQGVVYSATARTNVPYRCVGYFDSAQATAGMWVTGPYTVQGAGGNSLTKLTGSLGIGQTWQNVSRAAATPYKNDTAQTITLNCGGGLTASGAAINVWVEGAVVAQSSASTVPNQWCYLNGVIIPQGFTYQITVSSGSFQSGINAWELR